LDKARNGELEEMMAVLEGGVVPIDYQNEGGSTALHYASANGHEECVVELLRRGARVLPNGMFVVCVCVYASAKFA
jgi:ankyrin repeat protein